MSEPGLAARAFHATTSSAAASWRWFWQDRKSFMGYLCGSTVVVNIAVAARIFTMSEAAFPQVPLILAALAAFDGAIFGINALHSVTTKRIDATPPAAAREK